jgi:hypothetical protein
MGRRLGLSVRWLGLGWRLSLWLWILWGVGRIRLLPALWLVLIRITPTLARLPGGLLFEKSCSEPQSYSDDGTLFFAAH